MSGLYSPRTPTHSNHPFRERIIAIGARLWKLIWWFWSTVVVGGFIVSVVVSYSTTGTSGFKSLDPRTWFIFRPLAAHPLPTILGLTLASIVTLSSYLAFRVQPKNTTPITEQAVSIPTNLNRQRLLAKIHFFWINGVLEQSLHGSTLIALGLEEQSDAVANPWRFILEQPNRPSRPLPPSTTITKVFDDSAGELLILGEPGSGKTTLLLQLARDLLKRAEPDDTYPIPVILNLSSWREKQIHIDQWIIEELNSKYQVPKKIGQKWIEDDQMLLLLDGLDEVAGNYQGACIEAINTYRKHHGLVPIVLCSRYADYLNQKARLQLHSAVVVQPLTTEQVDNYLSSVGDQLVSVREALHNDPVLQELLTTPLMLSILTLAYQGTSVQDLLTSDTFTARRQILDTYIQRMLQRRGSEAYFKPQHTRYWLGWLAQQLSDQNQTEFYIERIQPNWLRDNHLYWLYRGISTRLLDGLVFGICGGLIYKLLFELVGGRLTFALIFGLLCVLIGKLDVGKKTAESVFWSWLSIPRNLMNGLVSGLMVGLTVGIVVGSTLTLTFGPITGLVAGLISGLIAMLFCSTITWLSNHRLISQARPTEVIGPSWVSFRRHLLDGLIFGLILGLLTGVSGGPIIGLVFGLSGGFVYWLINTVSEDGDLEIEPAEIINWTWKNLRKDLIPNLGRGIGIGLVIGLILGLVIGLVVSLVTRLETELVTGFFIGLIIGLVIGMVAGLVRWIGKGWSSEMIETHYLVKPNQGIWHSARNSILITLVLGSALALLVGPIVGLITRSITGGLIGVIGGATVGVIIGFENGGRSSIEHLVLRLLLWRAGCMPLNYPRFLDYCAEHILLRKVGGGYIFIHRLLLEHFAALYANTALASK